MTLPWRPLPRALRPDERARIAGALRALAAATPRPVDDVVAATPFVSLYHRGRRLACVGAEDGRLATAFARALADPRFGSVGDGERAALAAEVSYLRTPAPMRWEDVDALEPGTHGVALRDDDGRAALLLPSVARDGGLDGRALVTTLLRKARVDVRALDGLRLYRFAVETVGTDSPHDAPPDGVALAAAWLAARIDGDGAVSYAVDPRLGTEVSTGRVHHARAAIALRALATVGGHDGSLRRARARMAADIAAALDGKRPVAAWPPHPTSVAGTLALAVRAGVPVERELAALARDPLVAAWPWHAAQVCLVLGRAAPPTLWRACVDDLARKPFAPWTALAARAIGDGETRALAERAIVDAVRAAPPHAGGVDTTAIPEVALTALAVEALVDAEGAEARAAVERARTFLRRRQLLPGAIPAALDGRAVAGAFPASPVADVLRVDITGHAVLALAGGRRRPGRRARS